VADDFLTFNEALDALRMREEDLKRLISEGELRAFRKGDSVQLRRSDVDRLSEESSGDTIEDEEIVFAGDEDFVLEDLDEEEVGMTTTPISEADTLLDDEAIDDLGEEVDLAEEEAPAAEALSDEGGGAGGGVQRSRKRSDSIRGKVGGEEAVGEATWERALVLVTAVVLLLGFAVAWSATTNTPNALSRTFMDMFKG